MTQPYFQAIYPHGDPENNFISKQKFYDDVFDVTKMTNYALKMVIDEKLNAFNDALNEIENEDQENGEKENSNRNGWILYVKFHDRTF